MLSSFYWVGGSRSRDSIKQRLMTHRTLALGSPTVVAAKDIGEKRLEKCD